MNMTKVLACRACLSMDAKLYDITKWQLQEAFENATGLSIYQSDSFPQYLCSFCCKLAQNSLRFQRQCVAAQEAMANVITLNGMLTEELLKSVDYTTRYNTWMLTKSTTSNVHFDCHKPSSDLPIKVKEEVTMDPFEDSTVKREIDEHDLYLSINEIDIVKNEIIADDDNKCNSTISLERTELTETQPKLYNCPLCYKKFNRLSNMRAHKRRHLTIKPYKCMSCDKTFVQTSDLAKHQRTHTKEKPYKCAVCLKAFSQSSHLTAHTRIHTKERPYKCDLCDKSFTEKSLLVRHRRVHSGLKPFQCDVCDKSFNRSGNLSKHRRIHTGTREYPCDLCDKLFIEKYELSKHRRTHTGERPYVCDMCDKAFRQRYNLICHIRCHTGDKPFKCDMCEKAFPSSSQLGKHKRTHSGVRQYICACGKSFIESGALKKHVRKCRSRWVDVT